MADEQILRVAKRPSRSDAYELRFELLRNVFYQEDKLWFYLFAIRVTTFTSALSGTAVVASVLKARPLLTVFFGFLIPALQMIGLVFGFPAASLLHETKKARFLELLSELQAEQDNSVALIRIRAAMIFEYQKQALTYWCVDALAWNRAYYALTRNDDVDEAELYPIYMWERLVRHLWAFSPERFRQRKAKNAKKLRAIT
jgi:hypothetical protein